MPLDPSFLDQLVSGGAARLMVSPQVGVVLEQGGQRKTLSGPPVSPPDLAPFLSAFLPAAHVQKVLSTPRAAFQAKHGNAGLRIQFQAQPFQFLCAYEPEEGVGAPAVPAPAAVAAPEAEPPPPPAAAPSPPPTTAAAPPAGPAPIVVVVEGEGEIKFTGDDFIDMAEKTWWTMKTTNPAAEKKLDGFFHYMIKNGASDLHLTSSQEPMLRLHGDMIRIQDEPKILAREMYEMLLSIIPRRNRTQFEDGFDTDFAYEIRGLARFRCNYFRDRMGPGAVFRQIPEKIPTAEQLGLSKAILELGFLTKGLVLVTGPTGSGKSTSLAALVDYINMNRTDHIITIEDPVEFVHPNKKCLVNQREVGVHTKSFSQALRAALREDPDIVLVGEMRDLETIAIAIETAETGHLVFGTLHTTTAPSTIDRIIDQFPPEQQEQIRVMLSESLKGVVSQCLCKKIGGGRVAAQEVLIVDNAVSNLIREGKTFQIKSIMQTQKARGNRLLNDALGDLVKEGKVEPMEAFMKAVDKDSMKSILGTLGHKIDVTGGK